MFNPFDHFYEKWISGREDGNVKDEVDLQKEAIAEYAALSEKKLKKFVKKAEKQYDSDQATEVS